MERRLRGAVVDYSFWDEMVAFVVARDPDWARENLGPWLWAQHEIDFCAVLDAQHRVVYVDDPTGTWSVGEDVADSMPVRAAVEKPGRTLAWRTPGGVVWIAAGSVHRTMQGRFDAPGAGIFVAGYVLSPGFQERVGRRLGLRVRLVDAGEPVEASETRHVATVKLLEDVDGAEVIGFQLSSGPLVPEQVSGGYWGLGGYFFGSLVLGLLLLALAMDRAVVRPLLALRRGVDQLRRQGRLSEDLPVERRDEIGQLAAEVTSLATELRDSEFSRSRSEGQLHALLDASPDDIAVIAGDGSTLGLKRSSAAHSLLPEGAAVHDPVTRLLGESLGAEVLSRVRRALETREAQAFECRTDRSGEERRYEGRIVPSGPGEAVVIWRDMTERLRAQESRARLTAIVDATPDFVATATDDGRLRYVNPAGRRLLGLGPGEPVESRRLEDLVDEASQERLRDEALPAALREGAWTGEVALAGGSPDGQVPVSLVLLSHAGDASGGGFLSAIGRDISDRKRFEERLLHLADHDPLTDLLGRRRFEEELTREVAEGVRYGTGGAVLFLDLDDFKDVNDSLGHAAGDELLIGLSRLLQTRLRRTDSLARLGGDEFGVLLPRAALAQAESVAAGLLEAMRREPLSVGGHRVGVTASIGIVAFPDHGDAPEELLARADLAMYQAKSRGRNGYCVYVPDADWQARVDSRLFGEQGIRAALDEGRLVLHAQPILDLRQDRVLDFELLLRMRDPGGRLVPPGAFLSVAERFGLIHAIDRWVVCEAIRLLEEQRAAGRRLRVSVNLSAKAFSDRELPGLIRAELRARDVPPEALALEVTESAAIADTAQAEAFAAGLREMGCRLALDDFGVGFSSLYHLKNLPVDLLKIDGSFVRDLTRNPIDVHLVRAIVEVGRALRKRTVAEFVTDAATLELLRECGVDYAQGYYVGRPEPPEQGFARYGPWSAEAVADPPRSG